MSKQLPSSDLTKHLQWDGQPIPSQYVRPLMSIEDIFRKGSVIIATTPLPAYRDATNDAYPNGLIASLPELVEMQVTVGKDSNELTNSFLTSSEELIGIDTNGLFTRKNGPLAVVFHGAGLVTPDRMIITSDSLARFSQREFDELLYDGLEQKEGKIPIYTLNTIRHIKILTPRFGVAVPYDIGKIKHSGPIVHSAFMKNPLVIARAGGREFLERYFEKNKIQPDNTVINEHFLEIEDFRSPKGVILESNGGFTVRNFISAGSTPFSRYWVVRGEKND